MKSIEERKYKFNSAIIHIDDLKRKEGKINLSLIL